MLCLQRSKSQGFHILMQGSDCLQRENLELVNWAALLRNQGMQQPGKQETEVERF